MRNQNEIHDSPNAITKGLWGNERATFYDPHDGGGPEYPDARKIIEDMIEELGNNFG